MTYSCIPTSLFSVQIPLLVHELLLTLWKKLPRHFGEHSKVCAALGMEALSALRNLQKDGALGKQSGLLGRTGLSGPRSSVSLDLTRYFLNVIPL